MRVRAAQFSSIVLVNLAPVMPVLCILAALSQLTLLVQLRLSPSEAFLPTLMVFVMFLAAVAATLLVEVSIDEQIREWTPMSLAPDWTLTRDRWETRSNEQP